MRTPKRKRLTPILTVRPPPDDPAPAVCWRFGAVVILRHTPAGGRRKVDELCAVLTPDEAAKLGRDLLAAAALADTTPVMGTTGAKYRQLPAD